MAILKHVQPGEPIGPPSATVRNAMIDAALDFQRRSASQTARPQMSGSNYGTVWVRNDSGADVNRYNVLGIDDVIITPTDNLDEFKTRVAFSCITPAVADHFGKFVILLEPLKDGAIGRGLIDGVCPVQINMLDAGHKWADVKDSDEAVLQSGGYGYAQILWADSGTGTVWAIIRVGVAQLVRRFELKDALTPASTSATAYACDEDWAEDTSVEFEVYDPLKRFRGRAIDTPTSGDKGSQGEARFCPDNGHWEIVWMQPHALVISCLASAANDGTSAISVDTVTVAQPTGGLLMAAVTSVANVHLWKCNDNANIDAIWDESLATPGWKAIQVDCYVP